MSKDMLQWAQAFPGVGEVGGSDLVEMSQIRPPIPNKPRSRPNRGRIKRTDRTPGLEKPPWDLIEELRAGGYTIPPNLRCLSYTPKNWRRGPDYTAWRRRVHAMWGYRCHLCGHTNAHTADHLIPLSVWSNQPYEAALSRPAHGIEGCDDCGLKCNSSRGHRRLAIEVGQYKPPIAL